MQPHIHLSEKKSKNNKNNIEEPDIIEKKLKKNNSFSFSKNIFINDDKEKSELIIKEKAIKKSIYQKAQMTFIKQKI